LLHNERCRAVASIMPHFIWVEPIQGLLNLHSHPDTPKPHCFWRWFRTTELSCSG